METQVVPVPCRDTPQARLPSSSSNSPCADLVVDGAEGLSYPLHPGAAPRCAAA